MASSPPAVRTGLVMAVALTAGALGYALGANAAPPPPTQPGLDSLAAELRSLGQLVTQLREAIQRRPVAAAEAAPLAPREAAPPTEPSPRSGTEAPPPGADEPWQRLAGRIHQLEVKSTSPDTQWLQRAREQNPQPNLAAVEDLIRQLGEQADNLSHRKAVERRWWLLSMAEVVQRLGMPSNIIANKDSQTWEYWLPPSRQITLNFRDGIVAWVSD